jgi:hypothetical protein
MPADWDRGWPTGRLFFAAESSCSGRDLAKRGSVTARPFGARAAAADGGYFVI